MQGIITSHKYLAVRQQHLKGRKWRKNPLFSLLLPKFKLQYLQTLYAYGNHLRKPKNPSSQYSNASAFRVGLQEY